MQVTIATGETKTRQKVTVAKPRKRTKRAPKKSKRLGPNLALLDAHAQAQAEGCPFTYVEYARLVFNRWQLATGKISDFPGQTQAAGAANILNYAWDDSETGARIVPVLTR